MARSAITSGNLFTKYSPSFFKIFVFFLVFLVFFIPIIRLVLLSLSSENGLSLSHYVEVLKNPVTWKTIYNTIIIVTGSTIISVFLGLLTAWIVAYTNVRHKKLLNLFIFLPFVIPSYITTLAWTQFMGVNGPVAKLLNILPGHIQPMNLYSLTGIILVMGISHYPLVYLLSGSVLRKIPRELEMAAKVSGGSKYISLRKITIPLALPGIASGGLLAFLASLDNFGIPAFLGIPANIRVLSTYIYEQIIGFGPSAFAKGAALSVILGIFAIIGTFFQWLLLRRSKQIETSRVDKEPRVILPGRMRLIIETLLWTFLIVTSLVPLLSMASTSLIKAYGLDFNLQNISFKHYEFILFSSSKVQGAIQNSLQLAFIVTLIGLFVGTYIAYIRVRKPSLLNKSIEVMVGLPYALPGTVLALAMIFTWLEPIPGWNPGIYGSIFILYIAYITRFLILQIRGSVTSLLQIDGSMEDAARTSGASPYYKWRKILIPLILPGLLSGAFLVFLTALTELTVSSLLWSSGSETIGLVIFNFEQAGNTTYSTAFSTIIVLLILIGFIIIFLFQKYWERKVLPNDDRN
ncbi:ABC transporter permease [Metabacillus sediminilitoris]|uniref:Iron ABC transporter permease n=1 Tax=Metabacillus sediminilitoris TaxID=2567941 RepID=A0A4S4BUE4_9BACI|nr:iron ABC transporter permease [Metabacillus sediminilitoris]QGQ44218.1 ABC transporter permease subunit [Metabacillus sediminilitoris]THF78182.1 iron ABC transporter permease [Metabacillus sediminilitoris]